MLVFFSCYADCYGPFEASVYLEHLKKANVSYKAMLVLCTSLNLFACKNMHDYIIPKHVLDAL